MKYMAPVGVLVDSFDFVGWKTTIASSFLTTIALAIS